MVRRQVLLNLDTHQRSLLSPCHLDLHHTPKGKLIRYNLKSSNSIVCFTLTFSRRSWHHDRWGEERSRQPEFFFNGIVGDVRSYNGGHINSWDQATRLANYWRRFYNIPEVHAEHTLGNSSWHNYQQPSDNADQTSEVQEVPPESEMEDDASITANLGTLPVPS